MNRLIYHFVGNRGTDDDLEELRSLSWEQGIVACTRHAWVWAIYCRLKKKGLPVSFSYEPVEGAINFIHGEVARFQLTKRDLKTHSIVGIRADFRPFPYGQFEIVQNKQAIAGRRIFMPHFSQPGLLSRERTRNELKNVCFSGREINFINMEQLSMDLREMGCKYVFKGPGEWQDMRDIDLLLGIRSFSKKAYNSKPPTKLFNAWLAGIPFVGGYDSAYLQVGKPDENYLRVSSYAELMQSIDRLRGDPVFYKRLVEAGAMAAQAYTPEKITDQWINVLETLIVPDFVKWRQGDVGMRVLAEIRANLFELIEQRLRNYSRADSWC